LIMIIINIITIIIFKLFPILIIIVIIIPRLGLPQGSIKATVLIENVLACFETHEILWELKHHAGMFLKFIKS
jgi:hypothetical protein